MGSTLADQTPDVPRERLDSWKAIAEYLKRDVATARRWEKTLGLPVRRVPGDRRGRSVFAYPAEIDAWLACAPTAADAAPADAARTEPPPSKRWTWVAAAALVATAVGIVWTASAARVNPADLRVELRADAIAAVDREGHEQWEFRLPSPYATVFSAIDVPARVVAGSRPAVYVITSHRSRRTDEVIESGELMELSVQGERRRSFLFDDQLTFNGKRFSAPWAVTSFAVDDREDGRRIAVAAHHYTWDPSVVTVLDDRWQRRGTFVHAGWVESVRWLPSNRLLIGGFSQAHNGGMLGLLDADGVDGQGPEPPGTQYYCESCGGTDRPIRMVVLPRTELNRVTGSRFNRAIVELTADRIVARTIEMPGSDLHGAVDVLYEFTHALDLISANFSNHYREQHRVLALEGKLDHSFEQCPDRDGPREILEWTPRSGWKTRKLR